MRRVYAVYLWKVEVKGKRAQISEASVSSRSIITYSEIKYRNEALSA